MLQDKYIFNKDYKLCDDINRVILVSNQTAESNLQLLVHPMHAIILSVFNGERTLNENADYLSDILSITKEDVIEIITPFIENKAGLKIKYDGVTFTFPQKVLVKTNDEGQTRFDISPNNYMIMPPYDFTTLRANRPRRILFVVNTTCATDCIYCYANKKHKYIPLSTERICSIIDEAKSLGVVSFELSGGEILLHPDWEIILKRIVENDYRPEISTKVAVTEDTIKKLRNIGIDSIQISIDTLDATLLERTLKVKKTYAEDICKTIECFDKYGFNITLKSTLSKYTCNCENVCKLIEFAKGLKNIKRYTCSNVGYSHYKGVRAFREMIPSIAAIDELSDYLYRIADQCTFEVLDDLNAETVHAMNTYKSFKKRSYCSGNFLSMTIIPDGKVTICEELYWNENLLIGDVSQSTIMEVWNSDKAKSLACIKQHDVPKNSPCSSCKDFEACRHDRGVCWKEVLAVYGEENWLYPDPRCPLAPEMLNNVYYE